jgi:hypothetical protein
MDLLVKVLMLVDLPIIIMVPVVVVVAGMAVVLLLMLVIALLIIELIMGEALATYILHQLLLIILLAVC